MGVSGLQALVSAKNPKFASIYSANQDESNEASEGMLLIKGQP